MLHRAMKACSVLLVVFACTAAALAAQPVPPGNKEAVFGEQRMALEQARTAAVDVLAPRAFAEALTSYQSAERDFDRQRDTARVNAQLAESRQALAEAQRVADTARSALATTLKTREDALAAEAPKLVPELWQRAAERFAEAATRLERGDSQGAQRRSAEAEVLLREAELLAIKESLLGEARGLIARADEAKVADFAPRTLEDAKRLVAQADQEVSRNRYDVTVPRDLAAQAAYQARHAIFLADLIGTLEERDRDEHALEEMLLGLEQPLEKLAAEFDVAPRFDQGYLRPLEDLLRKAQQQRQELARLREEAADDDMQIAALNEEIRRLEDRLGGVSQERIALQRRVDAQARLRGNIAAIESSFTPDEARVSRTGDDIVISLLGINFPVGQSTIAASNAPLMDKVRQALAYFPGASLVVEGHTDSQGGDSTNLILSQDRADAVKQYLVANMGLDPEKVTSIGYGETRPVASNDTTDGRARNRRIDLVIRVEAVQ